MKFTLPATGTNELLALISDHIPDDFINGLIPHRRGRGRRLDLSASQLWRTHLLAVLSTVHAFNLLVKVLPEQRAWRQFAHLSSRQNIPGVRMLHEFRDRMGVWGFRKINEHLLQSLIPQPSTNLLSVALIDATDLPASACGFKKKQRASIRL
jgi:hypothetical protein